MANKAEKDEIDAIVAKMEKANRTLDTEEGHIEADHILCVLLRKLGYGEVVDAWNKVPKWYA